MREVYWPERGDIVWMIFDPKVGHEQAGRQPALVLSQRFFTEATGLAVVCPITSRVRGVPYEVLLQHTETTGVVLPIQVKSLDIAYSLTTGTSDVFNLGIIKLGMQPEHLGILYGVTSLAGAALGVWIHKLKRLTFRQYATLDLATSLAPFLAYGVFRSLPLAIASFIFNFTFWRYQQIMYQHYVLQIYGTSRYKATIISLISNFRSIHEVWLALLFTGLANHIGVLPALGWGALMPIVFLPVLLFSITQFSANAKAEVASVNQ